MIINKKITEEVINVIGENCKTTLEIYSLTKGVLLKYYDVNEKNIIVTGLKENLCIFVILEEEIHAFAPFSDLRESELLNRWNPQWDRKINNKLSYFSFDSNELLKKELDFPKVTLINLCVIENFPIPRLDLSTGVIISYLRKKQIAEINQIDMQIGTNKKEIIKLLNFQRPDIIGISINFGQYPLSIEILSEIFKEKKQWNKKSYIVIGNIIPVLNKKEYFDKYKEIIISYREGENSFEDLIMVVKKKASLFQVKGIAYLEKNKIITTPTKQVNIDEIPLPALDLIYEIKEKKGALTLETSRGCDYAACSFCPREHKTKSWRGLSVENTVKQLKELSKWATHLNIKNHIFLADEEFIGEELKNNGSETERIIEICKKIENAHLKFDTSARADSIYNENFSKEWNIKRFSMLSSLKKAGLDRLFIGLESGNDTQLKRFGKGITKKGNIIALRILSAFGISIRLGFIMFDPLMENLNEIRENLDFLERTDILLKPVNMNIYTYEEILKKILSEDENFLEQHKTGKAVYTKVSYMLASMEVLVGSNYLKMVLSKERKSRRKMVLNNGKFDTNMGRYSVLYYVSEIGKLSEMSQKWIDSNFGLMYSIKSLYKTASGEVKKELYEFMEIHRKISQNLLRYTLSYLTKNSDEYLLEFSKKYKEIFFHFDYSENIYSETLIKYQKVLKFELDVFYSKNKKNLSNDLIQSIEKWYKNQGKFCLINGIFNIEGVNNYGIYKN